MPAQTSRSSIAANKSADFRSTLKNSLEYLESLLRGHFKEVERSYVALKFDGDNPENHIEPRIYKIVEKLFRVRAAMDKRNPAVIFHKLHKLQSSYESYEDLFNDGYVFRKTDILSCGGPPISNEARRQAIFSKNHLLFFEHKIPSTFSQLLAVAKTFEKYQAKLLKDSYRSTDPASRRLGSLSIKARRQESRLTANTIVKSRREARLSASVLPPLIKKKNHRPSCYSHKCIERPYWMRKRC